ncbi:MAG: hypothetical protein WD045_14875 [Pirellulaceae bacterium]
MSISTSSKGKFSVGDWADMRYGAQRRIVKVVEDRGGLGVGGRRLYSVIPIQSSEERRVVEMPEEKLQPANDFRRDVVDYLGSGGLVEILKRNLSGGKNQPRVWLHQGPAGDQEIAYRLSPVERGVGGEVVPFYALMDDRVFLGKRVEVADYLITFGLDRLEVEEIIKMVGTSP